MKTWQKEMQGYYRHEHSISSRDLVGFYLGLEKISKKYFNAGEMKPGDRFIFCTTNGVKYRLGFYNDYTTIDMTGIKKEEYMPIISKSDSYKKEYRELRGVEKTLMATESFIGERYPLSLEKLISNMQPGQIISFTDGMTYVCTENKGDITKLKEVFDGDIENFDPFRIRHSVEIHQADREEIQRFYNKNNKHLTERVEYCYSTVDEALSTIKNIENNIRPNETKIYKLGRVELHASMVNKGHVTWYDGNGNKINRSDVAITFGLLDNAIHKREYIREDYNDYIKLAEDSEFEKNMERLSSMSDYQNMYLEMKAYVLENKGSLTINTKFFDKENDYIASNIVFTEKDGEAKAFILTYEDNDFTKDIKNIRELSEAEFKKVCEQMYSRNHQILKTRTEEQLINNLSLLKETMKEHQKTVIETASEKTALNNAKAFSKEDITVTANEIANFIKSYFDQEKYKEKKSMEIER